MAKSSQPKTTASWSTLDDGGDELRVGQRVFYFLRDDEGGTDQAGGRKSVAIIRNPLISGDPSDPTTLHTIRDSENRRVVLLEVFPCVERQSFFTRAFSSAASREPGGFDVIQTGDTGGK